MTQRLTPERIEEIRARVMSPMGVTWFGRADDDSRALLAEIDALRAELAGAEERGRMLEREDVVAYLRSTTNGTRACREWVAFDVANGAHAGTGTTPPDAGDSGPCG
jgi:hypothetical protein